MIRANFLGAVITLFNTFFVYLFFITPCILVGNHIFFHVQNLSFPARLHTVIQHFWKGHIFCFHEKSAINCSGSSQAFNPASLAAISCSKSLICLNIGPIKISGKEGMAV